jgi:acetyl-CoA synthetase
MYVCILDVARSTSLLHTLYIPRTSMAFSTLVNNSTNNNGVHTSSLQTSTLLSSTNGFFSSPLVTAAYRTASTDSIWNESSLPEKIKTLDEYKSIYALSIKDPDRFWKMAAERLDWYRFPTKIKNTEFDYRTERGVDIKWYEDGILNVAYNCLDRHIEHDHSIAQQVAIILEPDEPSESRHHVTYGELLRDVKKFANVLKKHGVKKGDRVTVYMPMVVETCVALLACARIGAVHSVVFGGFSANNAAERIGDCDSTIVITSDFGVRGGKSSTLKNKIDQALKMKQCSKVKSVLVFERNHAMTEFKDDCAHLRKKLEWTDGRDFWVHEEMEKVDDKCEPEKMNAEDPLFVVSLIKSSKKIYLYYF